MKFKIEINESELKKLVAQALELKFKGPVTVTFDISEVTTYGDQHAGYTVSATAEVPFYEANEEPHK